MKTVAIYALIDPITSECRYIGRSIQPKARYWTHIQTYDDSHRSRWINKLQSLGQQPVMVELERVLPSNCDTAEIFWIALFRFMGANLTNSTVGGEGLVNPSTQARTNISNAQKRRFQDPKQRAVSAEGAKLGWDKRIKENGSSKHTEQHKTNLAAALNKSEAWANRGSRISATKSTPEAKLAQSTRAKAYWENRRNIKGGQSCA